MAKELEFSEETEFESIVAVIPPSFEDKISGTLDSRAECKSRDRFGDYLKTSHPCYLLDGAGTLEHMLTHHLRDRPSKFKRWREERQRIVDFLSDVEGLSKNVTLMDRLNFYWVGLTDNNHHKKRVLKYGSYLNHWTDLLDRFSKKVNKMAPETYGDKRKMDDLEEEFDLLICNIVLNGFAPNMVFYGRLAKAPVAWMAAKFYDSLYDTDAEHFLRDHRSWQEFQYCVDQGVVFSHRSLFNLEYIKKAIDLNDQLFFKALLFIINLVTLFGQYVYSTWLSEKRLF